MSKRNERLAAAMEEVMNCLNAMGSEAENEQAVREVLMHTHRTLQQSFMRTVIVPSLLQFSFQASSNSYDLRNLHSCTLAHKMLSALNQDDYYLPFV